MGIRAATEAEAGFLIPSPWPLALAPLYLERQSSQPIVTPVEPDYTRRRNLEESAIHQPSAYNRRGQDAHDVAGPIGPAQNRVPKRMGPAVATMWATTALDPSRVVLSAAARSIAVMCRIPVPTARNRFSRKLGRSGSHPPQIAAAGIVLFAARTKGKAAGRTTIDRKHRPRLQAPRTSLEVL